LDCGLPEKEIPAENFPSKHQLKSFGNNAEEIQE
jgi:hypothetical protein